MGTKKVILIGAGSRGIGYTNRMGDMGEEFQVVAVAEPLENRRNYVRDKHHIPAERCFESWEPLLALPKCADLAIIATMDRDHLMPALAAIEKGYDLLLEKPMGALPEECVRIRHAAEQKGVNVLVCHVLRFTPFFRSLKAVIDSGKIGEVVHIRHEECVGNVHQSHSFVRGNWGNSDRASCMILQKSCHDMDILQYLIGKKCTRVQSFGSTFYFNAAHAPAGSPERCIDGCPVGDTCPYNAVKLYFDDKKNAWFRNAATKMVSPTDRDVLDVLRNTQYGKCVFKCDNNVVDHQTVNLEFEGGATVSFSMAAFAKGERSIHIFGTKGEIKAEMGNPVFSIYDFETEKAEECRVDSVLRDQSIVGGHGGGDAGILRALCRKMNGDDADGAICPISETCENHLIAFAAEESRLTGKVIDMKEYVARFSAE